MNVVATALYYNPSLALQQLQAQGRTQAFFSTWFQVREFTLAEGLCCIVGEVMPFVEAVSKQRGLNGPVASVRSVACMVVLD